MIRRTFTAALAAAAVVSGLGAAGLATSATAETRVTYKSAKSTSSYYQMAVQIAEAMKAGSGGEIIVTVEESQGSVQNVKEATNRSGNYVFTTPPGLVKLALSGQRMFEPKDPAFEKIRGLFAIPSLTMHYVVRADAGIDGFAALAGKDFIIGKGSFGAREAAKNFELFGLKDQVKLVDVELNAAVPALKNGQVDGFATAGSYPAPNVLEAAAGTEIRLLSMSEEQLAATKRTRLVIPAGTYPGIDYDVTTTSLPVAAYTTTAMDDDTAYLLTKTFWEGKDKMAAANPWWNGVTADMLSTLGAELHPGALRYYEEAGLLSHDSAQ
ncbi:TAXI family TRAP transporter solute-binding subunit [Pelagibius sp.]|uniref:TAXI family TRAP transporter solute-binding subunit n=1 Tax=Pelagibius sp. TaxID=1931238 RepID=UPI003B513DE8